MRRGDVKGASVRANDSIQIDATSRRGLRLSIAESCRTEPLFPPYYGVLPQGAAEYALGFFSLYETRCEVVMVDMELDIKARYAECCSALRHYSLCVLNTRMITIAQGLFLLGGAGYLTKESNYPLSSFVSLFGLLFTYVLKKLQENYWLHCNSFIKTAKELENGREGPWSAYAEQRNNRHEELLWKYFVVNGPFNLLAMAFLFILGFDAYNLRQATLFGVIIGFLLISIFILRLYKYWRAKTGRMPHAAT